MYSAATNANPSCAEIAQRNHRMVYRIEKMNGAKRAILLSLAPALVPQKVKGKKYNTTSWGV